VSAANGRASGLGQTEVSDLPLLDQLLHSTGDVLDRHVRIDAVLIVQIDVVGLQPPE
jgi:hypothetical protein